ncbi:MAG: hypothetical protein K2X39_01795, partial [Silvanigrellaceae bacterium]|nr:hypothetical protein [Silvanigrellaceae bacterium]
MLSCNTYDAPHFNLIGSPLAHVNFRLGAQSTLEYKISSPLFEHAGIWQETGDIVQMTPFGISITGRKKHLVFTLGGLCVSPQQLEQLLKDHEEIIDACVIGDKMPYLSALIVLNPAENLASEKTRDVIQNIISKINETLPRNVTIKKFLILEKPFSESEGEKLSNGEINRLKIQDTRANQIASLYN